MKQPFGQAKLKKDFPNDYEEVLSMPGKSVAEKRYIWLHGKGPGKCIFCGQPTKFISSTKGYKKYCSRECACKDPVRIQNIINSNLQKYGVRSPTQLKEVKEKIKTNNLKKYGVEYVTQLKEFRDKAKQTCLKRYGVESTFQSKECRNKAKQTCLERYGAEYASQSEEVKNKMKQTCMDRYGTEWASQSKEIKDKTKQTCIDRYGVEYTTQVFAEKIKQSLINKYGGVGNQVKEFAEKKKQTHIKRYGVECYSKTPEFRERIKTLHENGTYKHIYDLRKQTSLKRYGEVCYYHDVAKKNHPEIISINENNEWKCKCPHPGCNKCDEHYYITRCSVHHMRIRQMSELCTHLLPIQSQYSTAELIIREVLDELGVRYECNKRDIIAPKEIDIYLPDFEIGIEINGVYWHSNENKDKHYHIDKYITCRKAGVTLISLWEDQIFNDLGGCIDLILYHLEVVETFPSQFDPALIDNGLVDGEIEPVLVEHDGYECWTGKQKET